MITVGVDLAAEPKSTAAMRVDWRSGRIERYAPADDDAIVAACVGADRIGIDAPFGWPLKFIDFVVAHRDHRPIAPADRIAARRPLVYRATDLYVQQHHRLRPLSVSADRLAHAAFRCAGLLTRLDITDRSGAGRAIETYPAGALRVWGLERKGYKRDLATCREIFDDLRTRLRLAADFRVDSDHELDALLCAIIARAVACGLAEPLPPEHLEVARIEGWIALPHADALTRLRDLEPSDPEH